MSRNHLAGVAVAIAAICAACSTSQAPTTDTAPDVGQPTIRTSETTIPADVDVAGEPARAGSIDALVEVSGGVLPGSVTAALENADARLVDPTVWFTRFGNPGLPELTGAGVVLTEAVQRSTRTDAGTWDRVDEAGWLAMHTGTLDELLDELAAAAGAGETFTAAETDDQGAACIQRQYESASGSWTVQGCDYAANYPGLLAVGVSWSRAVDEDPPFVDGTVAAVLEATNGEVFAWSVELGRPNASGDTLTVTTQIRHDDTTAVTDAVLSGPLAGWPTLLGDASVVATGPTGGSWTLSAGYARFDWSGSL